MTCKVLVIGAGAIGGFYGALLAKAGAEVAVVCRSDFEQVSRYGYTVNSCDLGQWRFYPSQILKQAADYQGAADYILLCTKVIPGVNRAELMRPAVSRNTSIVFIQNGVEIEQELRTAFPDNEVISGLAFICAHRLQPGIIEHLAYGRLFLGCLPQGSSAKLEQLCELFRLAGIECHASQNIAATRWQKCVWNAPFNPLSVLSDGLSTQDMLQTQEPLIRQIMQEVVAIAQACGYELAADIIDSNLDNTRVMPPYKTSMLLDYEQHRPMETEVILGNTVRAAQRLGVPCPHLETLYALMQLKELHIKLASSAK